MSISVFFSDKPSLNLHSTEPPHPNTRCVLEYLNEGGANFVFKILPTDGEQDLPAALQGKLLRLRKDLPHVQSALEQLSAFNCHFRLLFAEENVVQHELIKLENGVPAILNSALNDVNRPSHRLQDSLSDTENHGLLVTDMTPQPGEMLLQVKPKWLSQSPNAPTDAKRCRTCALRAQRATQHVRTATDAQESCPLEIISDEIQYREKAAQSVTTDERLQDYLVKEAQPVLQKLRECQTRFDGNGILNTSSTPELFNLCKAMTLRDCTLFLKRSGDHIDARLADLDLKQPEKLSRWKKVEQDLVHMGWYTNSEDKMGWSEEKICLLSQ